MMIDIRPMGEDYIHIDCLHAGSVDPSTAPTKGSGWRDAPDLPAYPWSDETIRQVATQYPQISCGWRGVPNREFIREMIRRYGSCAMLAWEDGKVAGQLRFYPLRMAWLIGRETPPTKGETDPDAAATLLVHCIMVTRPYDRFTGQQPGARRGVGQQLACRLIEWASLHGWKRILANAHADLDYAYGNYGCGGKAFWEKAGFRVISRERRPTPSNEGWRNVVETQAREKGMPVDEAWTWWRMAYDL